MTSKKFVESLAKIPSMPGDRERQVEQTYNDILKTDFPGITISNPYKCDGYFEFTMDYDATHNGRVMIEYKYDRDMSNAIERAKVIIQPIFYLKRFENAGKILPNIIVIADVNEVFVLHSNCLLKYLDEEGIDWTIAPSGAAAAYPDLVAKIAMDTDIKPFVRNVTDPGFDFKDVTEQIKNQNATVPRKSRITEHNIGGLFEHFEKKVLSKKSAGTLSTKDKVSVFIGCLIDPDNHYLHPKKMNLLCTPKGELLVSSSEFNAFFANYTDQYSPVEKKKFTEIADRLIEDTDRRKSGDFWTPTNFVDCAHERMEKVFGDNWKDEYVVWDCSCGTKNLTRDYHFKELYCSTLFQSELDMAKKYNPESTTFQFDFLNDSLDKLPEGLKTALEAKRKIMFLINPPFGTATFDRGVTTKGNGATKVNDEMQSTDGYRSKELIVQFLWRIRQIMKVYGIEEYGLGLFSNPKWMTGKNYKRFRKDFLSTFKYEDGFLFQASHFADVSDVWGITFNVWSAGETSDKTSFMHELVDEDDNGNIVSIGTHNVYNKDLDETTIASYVSAPLKGLPLEKKTLPILSKGVFIKKMVEVEVPATTMGIVYCLGGDVQHNNASVIMSGTSNTGGIYPLSEENFIQACVATTARKLIPNSWMSHHDEYSVPETIPQDFIYDSIMYQVFMSWMVSLSLPNGERMPNHFFWMSREEIMELANENGNEDAYNDANVSEDRFIYKFIQKHLNEFSPEAKAVMDKASELVRKSFKYRPLFSQNHEDHQVNNWDCGYLQLKQIWKDFLKKDFGEFNGLCKALADKIRPQIYSIGFLKK